MSASVSKTYRIGIIGFGHMHVNDILEDFKGVAGVEIVAGADTVPDVSETSAGMWTRAWNIKYARDHFNVPNIYEDYNRMLDEEKLDLVVVNSENAKHAEVAEAAAAHGVNILVEKPMAESLFSALRMYRAVKLAGVKLIVNWPSTWLPTIRKMKELVDAGTIGDVYQFKMRAGHTGPLSTVRIGIDEEAITDADRSRSWWHRAGTGGGALLDYCSYGPCLSRWYLGQQATEAFGMAANLGSPYAQVEDNAIIGVRYPAALALYEGSWTEHDPGVPTGPILYGSEGTLVAHFKSSPMWTWVELHRGHGAKVERIEADPLPEGRSNIAEEVIHHLSTGEPLHPTLEPELNLDAMAILDAAIRSIRSGKVEPVNNSHWCIG